MTQRTHAARGGHDLIAMPLGELALGEAQSALSRQFGAIEVVWFDRHQLRRHPLETLAGLLRRRYALAVLIASDLRQPRLRLTSLMLCLPRAAKKWRIDAGGNREAWALSAHLLDNAWPVVRHLAACALAVAVSEPLLRLVHRLVKPRRIRLAPPKRLLYLRSQLWLGLEGGGSVAHTAGVIGGLEEAGVEVQVVSSDRLPGVAAATRIVPPETWFDGTLRELEDLAYNVSLLAVAWKTARRVRPQAIYQRHTAFNCSGALLSRMLNVPLVLEFNSSELWKGRYWGGLHLRRQAALVERINLVAADRVVVVSEVLRQQLESAGAPRDRVVVIPNGVDPRRFGPHVDGSLVRARLGLDEGVIVVGFSGTFGEWHGIPTLAAVIPRVIAQRDNVRWLLIGDGPLRKLIGQNERVVQPGLVPHAKMPAYLAACDILVSPHGRQADGGEFFGSPTKLFEYMAAGRPIVASGIGQIAEVLENERSALLVAPDDPDALTRAIVRLIDDASERARLAAAARQAAVERHTWLHNAERVLNALGSA